MTNHDVRLSKEAAVFRGLAQRPERRPSTVRASTVRSIDVRLSHLEWQILTAALKHFEYSKCLLPEEMADFHELTALFERHGRLARWTE